MTNNTEEVKDFDEYTYLKYHSLEPLKREISNTTARGIKFYKYLFRSSELLEHRREIYRRQGDDMSKILQYRANLKD